MGILPFSNHLFIFFMSSQSFNKYLQCVYRVSWREENCEQDRRKIPAFTKSALQYPIPHEEPRGKKRQTSYLPFPLTSVMLTVQKTDVPLA